jgi:hypothetical protein
MPLMKLARLQMSGGDLQRVAAVVHYVIARTEPSKLG